MKRFLSLLLCLVLPAVLICPALAETADVYAADTCYVIEAVGGEFFAEVMDVVYRNGDTDVPYIKIDDFYELWNVVMQAYSPYSGYSVETIHDDDGVYVLRNNQSFLYFAPDGYVYFSDIDMFTAAGDAVYTGEISGITPQLDENNTPIKDENGNTYVRFLKRVDDGSSFSRSGSALSASLSDYKLDLYVDGDDYYLPLAVLNNLFKPGELFDLVSNGEYIFLLIAGQLDSEADDGYGYTQADYYYSRETTERSDALTELTYNLLCCELDLFYGLKSSHGISDDIDEYLYSIGIKERMLKNDGAEFFGALYDLLHGYFADFHSAANNIGPYVDSDNVVIGSVGTPASTANAYAMETIFAEARRAAGLMVTSEDYTEYIAEPYKEVGDTAYITFDAFTNYDYNYYDPEIFEYVPDLIGQDTMALVIYANAMINREDSPIKNVVIDLSLNGGGTVSSAIYLVSWVLGNASISINNPISGAQSTVVYQADVDLDGKITSADSLDLSKINVYCLTTLNSFSCGNLVPALFKDSGRVTLLGQTSGGGSCIVKTSITADGCFIQYSGNMRMSTVKNGSFYDIDQGVTPDFVISKPEHFYDREWLNSFIASLP